jgi:hypothetical protein
LSLPPPSRKRRQPAALVVALAALAGAARGQIRGQADVATQGYYQGGNSQSLTSTSGVAVKFQSLVPGLGFLSGSFEGYGAQNRMQTGENFLELRGAPLLGYRWTATAGDFRTPASLVDYPLYNIYTPEIIARGVRVEAAHGDVVYGFFLGDETISAGPRVPYRIRVPQRIMGVSARRKIGRHLTIGARYLQFSSSAQAIADNPYLFPSGGQLTLERTLSVQALYAPVKRLRVYVEGSQPLGEGKAVFSSIAAAAWESKALTVRVNYVLQGAHYFPLAGYFIGDRRGPFAEIRLRPWKRVDLYAAASNYRNNLEKDTNATGMASTTTSAGVTLSLPAGFSGSAQVSTVRYSSQQPGETPVSSNNRQTTATLSRSLGHHSVHVNWRELLLAMPPQPTRQRAVEFEDMYGRGHLYVGGAVRLQRSTGSEVRNSVYVRGALQGNFGRFSAFANVESGNDLANRTVFATSAYSTTVVGLGLRLFRQWNFQAEMFRNRLNMDLNPESIFVLQSGGVPVTQDLATLSTWSFYFRFSKQIRWGGGLPYENLGQFIAAAAPLNGSIEGEVKVRRLGGTEQAAGIPISLDGHRTVATGADGHYLFVEVAEGSHEVALSASELPAEYDPGSPASARVFTQARRANRADFEVFPLSNLEGRVTGPAGATLEGIVIRIVPGQRYTTTAEDGHFAFYNVHEGDYQLVVDTASLPENAELAGDPSAPAVVRAGDPVPPLAFAIRLKSTQKPIRKVLDRQ